MLVEACLQGDRHAFDELVDRYQKPLYAAAYRITGSVDDAMEATQQAFVNAYEKLHSFDPTFRFFSWIYRIAVNQALNLVSTRREQGELDIDLPGNGPRPDAAIEQNEVRRHLQRALAELAPKYRAVLVLKHLEGLSYREIGEALDLPEKTVKSRLFTARRQLRGILTEQGYSG